MSGLSNPYYNPEEFGLEIIHESSDGDDGLDVAAVWERAGGGLFWAQDTGDESGGPFADYASLDDLNPLTTETYPEFEQACASYFGDEALRDIEVRLAA